jgi:multiple sugar transport system permease protein
MTEYKQVGSWKGDPSILDQSTATAVKPEFIPPTGRAPQDKSGGDVRRSPQLRTFANKWSGRRERLTPYAFLCPATLALGIAFLLPMAEAVRLSLHSNGTGFGQSDFSGLENYSRILSDSYFYHSLWISVLYSAGNVILVWAIGLGTAMLIQGDFAGRWLIRCLFILPWAVPYVATALIWQWMFNYEFGIVPYLTGAASNFSADFLNSNPAALISVTGVSIWKAYPLGTVMMLAGLQSIPREQYEAATVDGAGPISQFIHVTLPGLRTISTFLMLLIAIWSFGRAFTIIYIMTGGGPARGTETVVLRSYLEVFRFFHPGTGAALGIIVLLISFSLSTVYLTLLYRAER